MSGPLLPSYYIAHGGGPWVYMDGEFRAMHAGIERSLAAIPHELGCRPRALLVVSAHWEAPEFTLLESARPGMLYDYGGFPPHTYRVQYPAPGAPELAARVRALLGAAGIRTAGETHRGYDHGVFVPLAVMYPDADIPVLAMSLKLGLDPAAHLAAGRSLAPLRAEGVLILGSGFSYHNMAGADARAFAASAAFDAWLQHTLCGATGAAREALLERWAAAPSARYAHPREEHLLPLMVAAGAGGEDAGVCAWRQTDMSGGVTVSSFRFGALPGG
jgi:aromatic ring-opening dioxygenase catalytic subunit (LigB family)